MAHARKGIRDAAVTALTGLATTGANVFPGRQWPAENGKLPALLVYTADELAEVANIGLTLDRAVDLVIEGIVKQAVADIENTLDIIATEVEAAIGADVTLSGACKHSILTSTEVNFSREEIGRAHV